jgi:hypothetical protein
VFGIFGSDQDAALRNCETLVRDHGGSLRQGAGQLREMLIEINPVLYPTCAPDLRDK